MMVFGRCKVNLGLQILSKREDGFHNLCSIFYPVAWGDAIEIIESKQTRIQTRIHTYGIPFKDHNKNLCLQAYELLKADYPLPNIDIHLYKNIPIGAGLGGGSSDAVSMLQLLKDQFIKEDIDLYPYAKELGSDCPFFLGKEPKLVSGIGDIMESIELDLSGMYLCICSPNRGISTAEAYANISPKEASFKLKSLGQLDIKEWKKPP